MRNKKFQIGDKYRGEINKEIFEVVNQIIQNGKRYIVFKHERTQETFNYELRHAQELLLSKIN